MHPHPRIAERLSRHAGRIDRLLAELAIAEKVSLCHAAGTFVNGAVPRLGVPALVMSDGPHGVREELRSDSWDSAGRSDDAVTCLPAEVCLGATWDVAAARTFGGVLGREARGRGKDVILGPGVNLHRTPLCGRNFEYLGEDPLLSARLGAALTAAIQAEDVAACVKHFACNDQELARMSVDARPGARTLRELHLPAFQRCVEAGALTFMGAYNRLHGAFCCQHQWLLNDLLKGEWGFGGAVISDWGGVHDTVGAALGGCDIEMGGKTGAHFLSEPFLHAVESGAIPLATLDDKVRRILTVIAAVGLWDADRQPGAINLPEHQDACRAIASGGAVLLKNDGGLLPLDRTRLRRLAVIGANANATHCRGGGSSGVKPLREVTPLEALRARLPGVQIDMVPGYPCEPGGLQPLPIQHLDTADELSGVRGWRCTWWSNRRFHGEPERRDHCTEVGLASANPLGGPPGEFSLKAQTVFTAPQAGTYLFALDGSDCVQFIADDRCRISLWGHDGSRGGTCTLDLDAGQRVALTVHCNPKTAAPAVALRWRPPWVAEPADGDRHAAAVAAARAADAVLYLGGLDHGFDSEGADRPDLKMPHGQDSLIAAVAAANPRTAVVLLGGGPLELPWLDAVPAVLCAWYGGNEAGEALADVLLGEADPGGRLPMVWPRRLADAPAHALDDYHADTVAYREGLLLGQRWFDAKGLGPLFPLGHGLSYTTFALRDLAVTPNAQGAEVTITITNTGARAGSTVVQCYAAPLAPSLPRPPQVLAGFTKVRLAAGESRRVVLTVERRDLQVWDEAAGSWRDDGPHELRIGFSARDLPLRGRL